jgi:integrase/recombinase XerD
MLVSFSFEEKNHDRHCTSHHGFFPRTTERERAVSPHTRATYAYAFQLLFEFASGKLDVRPSALQLEQLDARLVLGFLESLQITRGNGARTRNARLTAIKSFMHFIEYRVPSALEQVRQIRSIPLTRISHTR